MNSENHLLLDTSIIYRCASKFCAKELGVYDLGATQLLILISICENEGTNLQELVVSGAFDKGTISKVIQKLCTQGYIVYKDNEENRREKRLFTTDKTKTIIGDIYLKRQQWWELISKNLSSKETDELKRLLDIVAENARKYEDGEPEEVKIFGLQKLTLLDFPGETGSTVFLGGCNFRCPFCHNSSLVLVDEDTVKIPEQDVMDYLEKRKGLIDGVCVSGGEPLTQNATKEFIKKIKNLGYKVKLDTNGALFDKLKELIDEGLLDYVAMDIKNSPKNYGKTIGIENYDLTEVKKSVEYLKTNVVPYEFRTTVIKDFHHSEDFKKIGEWIAGCQNYYLQKFVDRDSVIQHGLTPPSDKDMEKYLEIVKQYVPNAQVR